MSYYTVDPYYNNQFFNECKAALKNNNIEFETLISIKPPYNWFFKIDKSPILVNYDEPTSSEERWLINIVQTLRPNEEYTFLRRDNDNGPKALLKFVENEPMRESRLSDSSVFFNVSGREELEKISKEYPGKIWYLGKYYKNKFRVCLANHDAIKTFIEPNQILLEKTNSETGRFEAELNFKIFRGNDALVKFTDTPFIENGKMTRPKIAGSQSGRFIL